MCEGVDVFHVTEDGWVHDGYFSDRLPGDARPSRGCRSTRRWRSTRSCAGRIRHPPRNIVPGSTGDRVTQLQIALVSLGYDLSVDGRYGPRTQAAVRDFQARNDLEVDGIAGPRTQEALGIGRRRRAGCAASPAATTHRPRPTELRVVVTPGEPVECTAEIISADVGRPVDARHRVPRRVGDRTRAVLAEDTDCLLVDVFHVTDDGWVYDGAHSDFCVDDLTITGMSVHTAAQFAELCGDGMPERRNVLPDSTGTEVEQVQIALVALGYPIAVDGTYGPRTEAAVRDFQAANDLEVDGIAGPDTQTALGL